MREHSVNRRPFRRRLAIRFAKLFRWLHIYLSMFGLAVVLFFSATGITLNHPDWFFGETHRTVRSEGKIDRRWLRQESSESGVSREDPADLSSQVNQLEVVEFLRQTHGIRGALTEFKVDESECVVAFKGPGYAADAFIDRDTGRYSLTQSLHGVIAVLNDLHKGRDTGRAWSIFIDASAIVLTFISLSGLVLLFYLKLAPDSRPRGCDHRRDHRFGNLPAGCALRINGRLINDLLATRREARIPSHIFVFHRDRGLSERGLAQCGQANFLEHRHGFPLAAGPGLVRHCHSVELELDLKESGKAKAGRVAHQGCAGVETELVWQRRRLERPGRMHMSTAIEVRADSREPRANSPFVVQPLAKQLTLVAHGRGHGVVARDDQSLGAGVWL